MCILHLLARTMYKYTIEKLYEPAPVTYLTIKHGMNSSGFVCVVWAEKSDS